MSEVDAQAASFRNASPQAYLAAVFSRYRNAASYHDRGVVQILYRDGDREQRQLAPVRVWFDHQHLFVEVYDVRLWSDGRSLTGWISDEASKNFDSQVLRRPVTGGRPSLETLLSDPILAERITAGLAGPPPQLEWLFAREPMKRLFAGSHRFEFGPSHSVDGRLCRSVRVVADRETYQFWIDQQAGVIRRVDLPPVAAPPSPGQPIQVMPLSLELIGASFNTPQSDPGMQGLPEHPRYVKRLVPLPPLEPPSLLGKRSAPFRLTDDRQPFTITERGGDRELTVLVQFSGDPGSMASLVTIEHWNASMPAELQRRVRVAVLADAQARAIVPATVRLPVVLDRDRSATDSLGLEPGALVILDQRGTIVWRSRATALVSAEGRVRLGAIVADVLAGVDVPNRIRQQWNEEVDAYRRALAASLVQ